ncbi:hypothetical protein RMSM_05911 [Rhodopirellula maiorica SM1]|uniref:Uncharacterized protein n=2 Tax=Novipirellula TaxID=2795426 RepID=M5RDL8_9BACT|nr:hypothetical protein RMSM_05911 [Rhodopirellula maiorica SM1]
MEDFCDLHENAKYRYQLLESIDDGGQLQSFRELVDHFGITDDWQRFRDDAIEKAVTDFFDTNSIPWTRD